MTTAVRVRTKEQSKRSRFTKKGNSMPSQISPAYLTPVAFSVTAKQWISGSLPYVSECLHDLAPQNAPHMFSGSHTSRHGKIRPEWTEDNAAAEDDDGDNIVVQGAKLEKQYSEKTAAAVNHTT